MSKRMKVLVSVLVAVVLLTVGGATAVMAEEPAPASEATPKGLLARVAEILDIPHEKLVNAFEQAQQEMREEAHIRALERAVEKGLIAEEEANQIMERWQNRLETQNRLFSRARIHQAIHGQQAAVPIGWHGIRPHKLAD